MGGSRISLRLGSNQRAVFASAKNLWPEVFDVPETVWTALWDTVSSLIGWLYTEVLYGRSRNQCPNCATARLLKLICPQIHDGAAVVVAVHDARIAVQIVKTARGRVVAGVDAT